MAQKMDYELTTDESSGEDSETRENCPICLLPFKCQDIGTPESCDHHFCLECIIEWSKNVNTCPFDRQVFHLIFARHRVSGPIYNTIKVADKDLEEQGETNPYEQTYCEICGESNNEERLLLCDICDLGYHMDCLTPVLRSVPEDDWFCPECNVHSEVLPSTSTAASTSTAISAGRGTRRPLRSIPRTSRNRRVFRRITNAIMSSESEEDSNDESSSGLSEDETLYRLVEEEETTPSHSHVPSTSSPRKRTATTRRKAPKRRKKSTRKRRTATRKGSKTRTKRKRRGSRRRSWISNNTDASKSVKSRLATRLGLVAPKPGTTLPMIKNTARSNIGNEILSIFGETPRAEQQTRIRNKTWTVSSNLAPVVNLGRRPFFPDTPPHKPTASTLTSSTDVLGELLPGLSLLSSRADLFKDHDGTLKLRNSKSADNLTLSAINSSDLGATPLETAQPEASQLSLRCHQSPLKSIEPAMCKSENSTSTKTSATSSPDKSSKISTPTKPPEIKIPFKSEDAVIVKQEPQDVADRLNGKIEQSQAKDPYNEKPTDHTKNDSSLKKEKSKKDKEHKDPKRKKKRSSRTKLKVKTADDRNSDGLKSFRIPKKSKLSVEQRLVNPTNSKSKTSIELNLKITLDGITCEKDTEKETNSFYSKSGCDKLEQYNPITGKPLQHILSSLYIQPEPVSLTVCAARPIKKEGRKLYATRDNEEILRNWKKEHGTPVMSPISSTDSSELDWSLPPSRTPDPVVEISTDEEDEKANMRRIVTQKLKLEAMKGIDLDVAFARSRSRSPLRRFNDPVTRLTPIKDRLGARKDSSRSRRSWSRDRERLRVDDPRARRRSPSRERRMSPRKERKRSHSRERRRSPSRERRRSPSRERRRSPSRERRKSPRKSPSRKRVSPHRGRRRSQSKSRGRRRSPSREKRKGSRSLDKRDHPSWSRDRRRSKSKDKRRSISRSRRGSISRNKRRSKSRDRRKSISRDRRISISRDRRKSISRDRRKSISRDRRKSISHDRHRSISRDKHRSLSHDNRRSRSRSRKNKRSRSRSPKRRDRLTRSPDRSEKLDRKSSRRSESRESKRRTNGGRTSSKSLSVSPSKIPIGDGTLASELKLRIAQRKLQEQEEIVELESDEGDIQSISQSPKSDVLPSPEKFNKKNKKKKHKKDAGDKRKKHKKKRKVEKSEIDLTREESDNGVISPDDSRSGTSFSAPSKTDQHDNGSSPTQAEATGSEPYSPTQMLLDSGSNSPEDNYHDKSDNDDDLEKRAEAQALQVIALLKNEVADPDVVPRAQPPKSVSQKPLVIDWLVQRSESEVVSTPPSKDVQSPSRAGEEEESLVSATEYNNKQLIDKLAGQERVADEVKMVLKPFYVKGTINKEEYKFIMRNCVTKIYQRSQGRVNPAKVKDFVEKYVGTVIARRHKT